MSAASTGLKLLTRSKLSENYSKRLAWGTRPELSVWGRTRNHHQPGARNSTC